MKYVLDASGAASILNGEPVSELWRSLLSQADLVAAPDLFISEISNVYWKYVRFSNLPVDLARSTIHTGIRMVRHWESSADLYEAAFSLSIQLKHSTYDCFYLVLAQQLHATLITADRKLATLAQSLGISVVV
jgi:predicted nucleic acid-binding protein